MKLLRKLYDWVLHWAETPYGLSALFILAFAESSFFPVPPDVLLIALAISLPGRAFYFALICTLGSITGGILGYSIGLYGYEHIGKPVVEFYHGQELMGSIKVQYDTYGFWGVLVAAVTPMPYKIFTISSGVFRFEFWSFIFASIIGRSFRFFLVAGLIWKYGENIKDFINRYFNLLTYLFIGLLVGGFVILKYVT